MRRFHLRSSAVALAMSATLAALPCSAQDNDSDNDARRQSNDQSQSDDSSDSNRVRNRQQDDSDRNRDQQDRQDDRQQQDESQRSDDYRQSDQQRRNQQNNQDQRRNERDDRYDRQSSNNNDDEVAALGVVIGTSDGTPRVMRVLQDSAANQAGLRRGDQILSIDGERFRSARQLAQSVRRMEPGDQIELRIRRDGESRSIQTRLDARDRVFESEMRRQQQQYASNRFGGQGDSYSRGQYDRGQYDRNQSAQRRSGYRSPDYADSGSSGDLQQIRRQLRMLNAEVDRLAQQLERMSGDSMTRGSRNDDSRNYNRSPYSSGDNYRDQQESYDRRSQTGDRYNQSDSWDNRGDNNRDRYGANQYDSNRRNQYQGDSQRNQYPGGNRYDND
ncbi:PDZ domain-containing protein [Botrimarina sp.]|uniref:PDZ domain-containing protein n=1 Tax=Botrimarina sp. TaxID=2795802 RepID=UPI0032EF99C6